MLEILSVCTYICK